MTVAERRASLSLATLFALRMLGLFLVLPVFALEAAHLPGGDNPALMGLALGAYGLTQALLQLPLGLASDRFGRKPVIVLGLLVFAAGSAVAALAASVQMLAVGRALQGAGAISAAVTALLADATRAEVRTKGMALIGISIALVFALALVVAPPLAAFMGLSGLFWLTAALAVAGLALLRLVPDGMPAHAQKTAPLRARLGSVIAHPALWRLNAGVFALHTVQMAMWVSLPAWLVRAGLPKAQHWQVYLPTVLASFVLLGGLFAAERRGKLAWVLRLGIALLALVQLALWALAGGAPGLWVLGLALLGFFAAFNLLEASLPSLVSRLAPANARGTALGVYNTLQSLGLFAGGALGGWLLRQWGDAAVFAAASALALAWLLAGWSQPVPPAPVHPGDGRT